MAEERGKSGLNPNAPLFIPAALKQVEDFSPEWWQLVTTSTWYGDYWMTQQHQYDDGHVNGGYLFNYNETNEDELDFDVADLLPDGDDLFQEFAIDGYQPQFNGLGMAAETQTKYLSNLEETEAAKYAEKLLN
ncbi:hypothetical protein ACFE04_030776 [Oxalis oulophora]